ncbi:Uncharacterized protein DAT39_016006, partial [Clarias magur]
MIHDDLSQLFFRNSVNLVVASISLMLSRTPNGALGGLRHDKSCGGIQQPTKLWRKSE